MKELNILATKVLDCAFTVHRDLGPGLLESAYQMAMEAELFDVGIPFVAQQEVPLEYKGRSIATAYRLDLFIDNKLIVELKSVEVLHDIHLAQVLTYLKLTNCRLGLLLNYNVKLMKTED
ncbi:GxxExxY protein [Rhodohalobacter barkolensis]|uniref:GxxExxY protein n=1 Tax=Rhodohalobacter barkolensis TaxID=2053187 RepID=A0A2N0VKD8_9BACT|nr:GxxExxY protein [Rhodohalobacter barkolensis]PKD44640.1 GxxExxY protein [Rhodohalobacter barkolensis]